MTDTQRRRPITREAIHTGFNGLIRSIESQYDTFDGYQTQGLLRPVDDAIREAQRLVDIAIEKTALADQERRAAGIQQAIEERKQKIAALEERAASEAGSPQ